MDKETQDYIDKVKTDLKSHGKLERLAVERFEKDLERTDLTFDVDKAERVIRFCELLTHTKGPLANTRIKLEPWQKFIIYNVYGFMRPDGFRRYRYFYCEVARKNGKSTFLAALGLYHLLADGEGGAEVYTAAVKRDQARIVFDMAQGMIRNSSRLSALVDSNKMNVSVLKTMSKLEPLPADARTLDGLNPSLAIVDEYHSHKTSELYNVLKSASGARMQPVQACITTAGFNKLLPCYELRGTVIKLLEGTIEDDSQFGIIFTIDDDDDWNDPNVWIKANPNMNVSVRQDYLEQEYNQAKNNSSEVVNFQTKNLNVWTDASEVWIPSKIWNANEKPFTDDDLEGQIAYGGLDLASIRDITAFTLVFPQDDGSFLIRAWYFIPTDSVIDRSRRDGVPYRTWSDEGHIVTTEGNVVDYDAVAQVIFEAMEKYDIKSIGYDRWNSSQLVVNLLDEGVPMTPFGQGFGSMSAPSKELEKLCFENKLHHNGDPVLRWAVSNVEIERNPAGDIKPSKKRSSEKIDPVVSLVMAIGEHLNDETDDFAKFSGELRIL